MNIELHLNVIMAAMKCLSSFLIYSAILQHDEPFGTTPDSRFLIDTLKLLNTTNEIILDLKAEHECAFLAHQFLFIV